MVLFQQGLMETPTFHTSVISRLLRHLKGAKYLVGGESGGRKRHTAGNRLEEEAPLSKAKTEGLA